MATVVQRFSEGAYIITADGEEIPIYEGMILEDGDIIVGDVATIEDADAVDPGDDITSLPAELAEIQQAILEGADPTQVAERTAAGGAPGAGEGQGDGGGNSFVALDRTGNEVDPTAGYPTGTFTSAFETPQEEPPAVLDETPLTETPVEPEPQDPVVTTVIETKTEVRTEVDVRVLDGAEVETGRTTDVQTTTEETEDGTLVTTTTTTTVTYDQETNTITTTTTITETYEREVTTTTYPDGTEEVVTGEWELTDTQTETTEDTETTNTPREEVIVDVEEDLTPFDEPTVVVTKEYREEVDVQTTTETNVGDEYEVDRSTDTVVTEEEQEDGTLKTTTTTTTINYNQETNTITTTVTTTEYYEREITTTTYPDGTTDVVTTDWELVGTQTNTDESTDTVETPRQEVLVDAQEELIPFPPENLLPVAEDDIFNIDEDTTLNGDVTTNDDESGDGAHHYELVGESIPGLTFNDDGTFEYVPTDVDGDQTVTFDYYIVDEDGDRDPATVTINVKDILDPEEPELVDTWFIAQGGNHPGSDGPTNVDYELVTGERGRHSGDMELVISNKGLGDYKVQEGDSVTFTFELVHTDAVYGEDYSLNMVSKAPQYDIGSWNLSGNMLTVNIVYNGEKDFNLAGNTFAIEVTSLKDDGHANVGFDMTSVTHHDVSALEDIGMTQWETNDDVVIGLNSSSDFIPETRDLPTDN